VIFKEYVLKIKPEIVHFGHLSHLSTNLIRVVKKLNIPIVYTIHDFWLFCVKGQMINKQGAICAKPSIKNCTQCSPYVVDETGIEETFIQMKEIINMIDVFISPSHTLQNFFISQGIAESKIKYLKYGFNTDKIKYNKKIFHTDSKINFGFMGRVIPTKGIKVLVDVFNELPNEKLSIYGNIGAQKRFLETENIVFKGGYNNNTINNVLNDIDVLIVPSIWYENAPLVIQEAFLAGIPVITSDIGGMAELVRNEENGFTFKTGCSESLKKVIVNISSNPEILNDLIVDRNSVVDISVDVEKVKKIYEELVNES
jgi:glycosyltransferase involved in cell wall biosynthesis